MTPKEPSFDTSQHRTKSIAVVLSIATLLLLAVPAAADQNDPWEPMNRKFFWFNEKVDSYVLRPVSQGWTYITPQFLRTGLHNFSNNLSFPVNLTNNILQWKWKGAGVTTGRFAINTTVGLAGFFDLASGWGLESQIEDTGQTFGKWGIPSGPFLMLPFLGPSNPRDTVGFAADSALAIYPFFAGGYPFITMTYTGINVVNERARSDEDIDSARAAALDLYVFVRDAYTQRREALIRDDTSLSEEEQEDLYGFEEEF